MADEFDLEKLLPYILNTVPGYDAVKNRHELAALGEAITSPIKAHVEQEQARQAAKQLMGEHAAANLGIDPEGGLPAAGRAPIAAPPTAQVPDVPPAAPPATVLPPFQVVGGRGAAAPAGGAPAPDPTGPYAQSPSMLPGTDPEEIAAAKRAADKQAAAAKFAAEEQEVRDAQAAGKKAGEMPWWQKLLTAAADPETQEIVRKRQETAQNKPLQELMQRRELLAKMREEKSKLSEQERQESLNDPDSELTKTSALALRSLGVAPPKGYTAAMYEQMKGIAQLAGAQKNDAAKLIVDQHREAETERQNRAQNAIERERIAAAACFYGGQIARYNDEQPRCPTILHFGKLDPLIPPSDVGAGQGASHRGSDRRCPQRGRRRRGRVQAAGGYLRQFAPFRVGGRPRGTGPAQTGRGQSQA